MRTSFPCRRTLLAALFVLGGASLSCAGDLARASSGAIGCPHAAIEIDDVSVGWSETSWKARCRGLDFYCSGEDSPSCAPQLEPPPVTASSTPVIGDSAPPIADPAPATPVSPPSTAPLSPPRTAPATPTEGNDDAPPKP